MRRIPLLIIFCLLWSQPTFGDDQQLDFEAGTIPATFEVPDMESMASANIAGVVIGGSNEGSATAAVSNVATPFDFSLLLTLLVGITGLISIRRHVKS